MSERPHRVRTWAPKGKTPVLQYSFTWNQLSAVAGVTFWNIYFKLVKGAVRAPEIVAFLKNLKRHLAGRKLLIIWDRLQAHRSRLVRDYVETEGGDIKLEFSAALRARTQSRRVPVGALEAARDAQLLSEGLRRTQRLRARQAQTHAASQNSRRSFLEASRVALLMLLCLSKVNRKCYPKTTTWSDHCQTQK